MTSITEEHQSTDGGDGKSEMASNSTLSAKDIEFLSAVQQVNERSGYQPGTDERPPATTGAIADASELNKNEVNYRFNQRGFDSDGLGYIEVYQSKLLDNGALSAKSAELTERGERVLADVLDGSSSSSTDVDGSLVDRVSELEDEVTQLREENDALREMVQQFDEEEMGAWNQDREKQFEATLNAMIAYQRIFADVFGIDVAEFRGDESIPEGLLSKARQRVGEITTEK